MPPLRRLVGTPSPDPPYRARHSEPVPVTGLGRWSLRRFGRYAGPLYAAMVIGSVCLYAAGIYATS
ncbi:hypothetical protein Sxan_77790 [Streptomyces xanthophaeus]|uniref:Uncharacterized protein n=1 Tax=Streptomyces xanthophaeus TaxID=67385 RepID=A0A919H4T3_9ACTN|nr:hypothetical protein Sxan_77790 [Streptomyces xanthophaeus]